MSAFIDNFYCVGLKCLISNFRCFDSFPNDYFNSLFAFNYLSMLSLNGNIYANVILTCSAVVFFKFDLHDKASSIYQAFPKKGTKR